MEHDSSKPSWYLSVGFVICMLFLVLGPFGLPLLWKSPRFSSKVKMLLTVATLVYTLLILISLSKVTQAVLSQFNQALNP